MKRTPNYNLNKLEGPDTADLTQFNPNWDTLDTNLKQLSDDHVTHLAETAQQEDVHGLKTLFQNQQFENLVKYGDFPSWSAGTTSAPDGWMSVLTDVAQRVSGQYFPNGFRFQGAGNSYAYQIVIPSSEIQYWRGKAVTFGGWIKSTQGNIWIQDKDATWESRQTTIVTSGNCEFVFKTATIPDTWSGNLVIQPYAHNGAEIIVEGLFIVKGELPVAFAKNPQDYVAAHKADNAAHGVDGKVNKAGDTMTGALQITSNRDNAGDTAPKSGNFSLEVAAGTATIGIGQNNGDAVIQAFGTGTAYSLDLCPAAGIVKTKGNEIWHAGNLPYEEGTWTPVIYGETTAGTPTYIAQNGVYKRTGNQVYAWGRIQLSSKGGMAGDMKISGLPFTSRGSFRTAVIGLCTNITFPTNTKQLACYVVHDAVEFHFIRDGRGWLQLTNINVADDFLLTFTAVYDI
ncbi:MAG: hypothetical protein MJA84_10355 [Firmicutes bacterium]|nr:hypothetical protein [Bacillota bacterium]